MVGEDRENHRNHGQNFWQGNDGVTQQQNYGNGQRQQQQSGNHYGYRNNYRGRKRFYQRRQGYFFPQAQPFCPHHQCQKIIMPQMQ